MGDAAVSESSSGVIGVSWSYRWRASSMDSAFFTQVYHVPKTHSQINNVFKTYIYLCVCVCVYFFLWLYLKRSLQAATTHAEAGRVHVHVIIPSTSIVVRLFSKWSFRALVGEYRNVDAHFLAFTMSYVRREGTKPWMAFKDRHIRKEIRMSDTLTMK